MEQKITRWPSFLIVAGSAVLMQIHAIQFWIQHVGDSGVAFSLSLEVVALWLWWKRRSKLAVLASFMLIAGPFYQLSAPTVEALRSAQASASMLAMDRAEVAQLEASVTRFEDNSAERTGWAKRIDTRQAALDAARERVRNRLAEQVTGAGWREVGVVGLQALALLVVMITQVLAVADLRPADTKKDAEQLGVILEAVERGKQKAQPLTARKAYNSKITRSPVETKTATDIDTLAELVATEIETEIATNNETQKTAAERLGVRPADISMIRNHAARRNEGKETVSTAVLQRLTTHYNINVQGCTKSAGARMRMGGEHGSRNA